MPIVPEISSLHLNPQLVDPRQLAWSAESLVRGKTKPLSHCGPEACFLCLGRMRAMLKVTRFLRRRDSAGGMSNGYVVRVQGEEAEPETRVHKTPILPLGHKETRTQPLSTGFQQSNRLELSRFLSTIAGHRGFAEIKWREQNGFRKPVTT